MTTMTIKGLVFPSPVAAIRFAEADDSMAIQLQNKIMVVTQDEARRLESLHVPLIYLSTAAGEEARGDTHVY